VEPTVAPPLNTSGIEHSLEIKDIAAALAKAQANIKNAERDAENPYFHSSYATLASSWDAIRKPMTDEGLSIIQGPAATTLPPGSDPGERAEVKVTTMLLHSSGQWFKATVTLPVIAMRRKAREGEADNDADRAPGRITPQAIGSAITYGRRYGLECLAGVAPEAEDDDGNASSGGEAGAKHTPIPEDGIFEDAVKEIKTREVPKKGSGSFIVVEILTAAHGKIESYEREAKPLQGQAGTGQLFRFKTEKGQYGWRLKQVDPLPAPTSAAAGEIDLQVLDAAMFKTAPPADDGAALQWIKATLEGITIVRDIVVLKNGCVHRKGEFWTDASKAAIARKHEELKRSETPAKPDAAASEKGGAA